MPFTTTRCLFMPCSQRKNGATAPTAAFLVYDGPLWRDYRRTLERLGEENRNFPFTFVLSALYGIITAATSIELYDVELTTAIAATLLAAPSMLLCGMTRHCGEIMLMGGRLYRQTMITALGQAGFHGTIREPVPNRGIGDQRKALRAYLEDSPPTGPPDSGLA